MVSFTIAVVTIAGQGPWSLLASSLEVLKSLLGISSVVVPKGPVDKDVACRICHMEGGCLSVCNCRGSSGGVHMHCLEAWRRASWGRSGGVSDTCEVCRSPYTLRVTGVSAALLRLSCLGVVFVASLGVALWP
eukprot:TRINITY_DN34077_c0_g1_i1.p1 TRINITY_DN34077_c0_g1~~TRINITY_DN34077_c0_g1_i1.p1  ORF type:complete len:133 (-),score=0.81 TRINITY_DN34077_c0_g1_i1:66-464(-)